ncbi:MAG: VWA domain-containing protein [Phycisphaerae bacterium]|jgi:DNA-directed RNA polymerase subunit RPC12/RpoP|nr:VWA domain-containing protein [Phycisphaerae bacterium]
MAALFRCPECNHPLHNRPGENPKKGCVLKCPECGARLVVPAALAALPQPQIDTPPPAMADDGPEAPAARPVVLPIMARSMPWLMSICFHVALAMILMFAAMLVANDPPDIPRHNHRGISVSDNSTSTISDTESTVPAESKFKPRTPKGDYGRASKLQRVLLKDPAPTDAIGTACLLTGIDPGETEAKLRGRPDGTDTIFRPRPRRRKRISTRLPDQVYLIDRSGSMVDTFDRVRREMLLDIAGMTPDRKFHVVLFSDGRPIEKTPRGMTPAGETAKVNLVKFLNPVRASGQTDPIPAINRAFDALARGSAGQEATIHLLTDGVFPDNDAVMKTIRRRNTSGLIRINTILYGNHSPTAEKVLRRIATDTDGEYRFISRDE